ncbi:ABC-type multidrug transport system ATPase subunit [Melghiribacillus thermohalophilus]|uniref:ABC-type multidrug transport system ATPase subunit n=1 Tax=Melghiribacillus thermohalophilus TaxID=1324956 RepID=A0A4R3NA52_9BACI|nr:ABC-type multidrug transport system ATPase subunit [Melghiribacillus thermohalophilus]
MSDLALKVKGLEKKYHEQTVVFPIDLELQTGQVLALCGGNGAGKSTILKMIAGIVEPTQGSILVDHLSWDKNRKEYAKKIGYMPDHFSLDISLTVRELLHYYARLKKVPGQEVDKVLEKVGLVSAQNKSLESLSKGMRQRFVFAQAMLGSPKLLILDEPTNGLDPYWMKSFVDMIRDLKKENQAIIFSTHHLDIAEETADLVVFLHEGKVMESGSLAELKQQYNNLSLQQMFTRLFFQT